MADNSTEMARSLQPCLDDLSVQSDTFYGVHQQVYSSRIKLSLKSPFFLSSQKVTSRIRTTSMSDEEDSRPIKRRKVRKGTQSCWECKRRKVRCLISQGNVICDNCRRRNATCISQDLPDRPAPSACNVDVDDRLSRMEFLIEQLIDKAGINSTQTAHQVEKPQYQISSSSSQQPPLAVSFIPFCHPFTFFSSNDPNPARDSVTYTPSIFQATVARKVHRVERGSHVCMA